MAGRAALGLVVAAVVLGAAEAGLRASGAAAAWTALDGVGWRVTANLDGPMPVPAGQHGFTVHTNADGLRTHAVPARSAAHRVAVMGDSTVFGWGVDEGGAVADGLEAGLRAAGLDADVVNAGVPGYSTVQAAWLYPEVVRAYRPDAVIVFPPLHDFNLVLLSDRDILAASTGARSLRVRVMQDLRLYQFLRQEVFSLSEAPLLRPGEAGGADRVPRVSDDERATALRSLAADVKADGGSLLLGYLPQRADLGPNAATRPGEAWLRAFADAEHLPLVDARACCRSRPELVLPDDPGHLTAEGNRLAGEALVAPLRAAMGW